MKEFYFTNPTYDRRKGKEIQLLIEKETGLKLNNPFYDHTGQATKEIKALDAGEKIDMSEHEIVDKDLQMIDEAEGLIAYITDRTSWGSIQECFYAYRVARKPTYIIFEPKCIGRDRICLPSHPWVERNCTRVFTKVEGFIQFAREKYPYEAPRT